MFKLYTFTYLQVALHYFTAAERNFQIIGMLPQVKFYQV